MEGRGTTATSGVTNLVLVGKTGNGKSATGNSILGRKAFKSLSGPFPVTETCQLEQFTTKEGRKLNVIDTPGLYDPIVTVDFLGQEIVKCMDLAKEGLHGFILVYSVKNRFNPEEATILETLQTLFGEKIFSYMVVLFTGGDELEENEETLEDYLRGRPRLVQELLPKCNNRKILFNNKSKSKTVKERQVTELLKQIDIIISENGGRPYSNEMFREAQEKSRMRKEQEQILVENMEKQRAEQTRLEFEKQLAVEREQAERDSREKISMLKQKFEEDLEAEQSAREEIEKDLREKINMVQQKLEQGLEAEQFAREQVERDSREKISMLQHKLEQVERDSREKISMFKQKFEQHLEAEQSARKEIEKDSREKMSMLEHKFEERLTAEECAREQLERDSREKIGELQQRLQNPWPVCVIM